MAGKVVQTGTFIAKKYVPGWMDGKFGQII